MKCASAKWVGLTGCVIAGFAACASIAAPIKITPPDAALIAAVDAQTTNVNELTVFGDFEGWCPNLYADYKWARETVAVSTNGLFQLNYVVLDRHGRIQDELSVLLFRPGFQNGVQTGPQQRRDARHGPALRGSRSSASAEVVRAIEEVLEGAQLFQASIPLYAIHGDAESISLVSSLPGRYPGSQIQRVRIFLERAGRGTYDVVMEHAPLLWDITRVSPERVVLAENASLFHLEYWYRAGGTWEAQSRTNLLPSMVRVTVGTGKTSRKWETPQELTSRIVAVPSVGVPVPLQGGGGLGPGGQGWTNRPPGRVGPERNRPPDAALPERRSFMNNAAIADSGLGARISKPVVDKLRSDHGRPGRERDIALKTKLSWLGRSGVELAKAILSADLSGPSAQEDSLKERWAGGSGIDGDIGVVLPQDISLGTGRVSVHLTDHERRFNINIAGAPILQQAVTLLGVHPGRHGEVMDSIADWIDPDGDPKTQGAESNYYRQLSPPYFAKNGPTDDISELLMVKGITPEIYYGPQRGEGAGLVGLFTSVSSRTMNINTTSRTTLQLLPPIDANIAAAIIQRRAGPDGIDGTQDDTPFRNVQELSSIPGMPPPVLQQIQPYVGVRSIVFEARIEAEIDGVVQRFVAILVRNNVQNLVVLSFYAE
jgi:type II secretory pathway component PulK